ncbi:MAG: signal peptide peptidase SppA [Desulfobulbaceae bacterium]|nr:signal peptide peptidase SppA [Desulfobulbaceae bacterium]
MTKGLFRQDHPYLFGLIVLGAMGMIFWAGVAFFISRLVHPASGDLFTHKNGIGVIDLQGVMMTSEETLANLAEFRRDKNIKAVLVRIDSPGGAVGAAQEIYQDIKRTAEVKPVVASMASVAASGGYYAALGATKIFANPGTMTGSIGVIIKFANLEKILDKIGYQTEVVKSGANKDIGSFSRQMTEAERALLQEMIDDVHNQFIAAVVDARKISANTVRPLADGRIFTGSQAKAFGLIDQLGNFTDAVNQAMQLAGLAGEEPNLVYPAVKTFPFMDMLVGDKAQSLLKLMQSAPVSLMYQWNPSVQ